MLSSDAISVTIGTDRKLDPARFPLTDVTTYATASSP